MELSINLLLWCHRYEFHTRNDWKLCCFPQVQTVFKSLQSEAQKPDLTESNNKSSCVLFLPSFELCSFFPLHPWYSPVSMHLCLLHRRFDLAFAPLYVNNKTALEAQDAFWVIMFLASLVIEELIGLLK